LSTGCKVASVFGSDKMYVHLNFDGIFRLAHNPSAGTRFRPERWVPGIVRSIAGPE